MEKTKIQAIFYIALLTIAVVLNFIVFRPYLAVLVLALTLGIVFDPVYQKMLSFIKNRSIAAFLTALLVFIIVVLPLGLWGQRLFVEAQDFYAKVTADPNSNAFISGWVDNFKTPLNIPGISFDLNQYLKDAINTVVHNFAAIFSSIFRLIITTILVIVSFFFVLKDGDTFKKAIFAISPFPEESNKQVFNKMALAINSIIRGQILVSVIQTVATVIGFSIFGIPNPILWGSTALIGALVPSVGTAIVLVPGILYLYFTHHTAHAIGLLIWALLAVGLVDNFLGPYVMNRKIKVHPVAILFAVLGGVSVFGPVGFLLGPIILTSLIALFEIRSVLIHE